MAPTTELVYKDGALHLRQVVENFQPIELAQLQTEVEGDQQVYDDRVAEFLSVQARLAEAKVAVEEAEKVLANSKSQLELGSQLVAQAAGSVDTGQNATSFSLADGI